MSQQQRPDPKEQLRARLDELETLIEEEEDDEARAIYQRVYESLAEDDS